MSRYYTAVELTAMTDVEVAAELSRWADVREHLTDHRARQGKAPLDTALQREAARRLRRER